MTVGERIQCLRKKAGLSQEQLAAELNVSRQSVSKWESDIHLPELEKCIELCRIFNVSLDELLLGEEVKKTGLSEEQLATILKEMKPEKKPMYFAFKLILGFCAVGLVLALFADNSSMKKKILDLQWSLQNLSYAIQNQTSSIQNTITEALQNKDAFINDFNVEVLDYKLDTKEVEVKLDVIPKSVTDQTKMNIKFVNENDEILSIDLERNENTFSGNYTLPIDDYKSVFLSSNENGETKQMAFNYPLNLFSKIALEKWNITNYIYYESIDRKADYSYFDIRFRDLNAEYSGREFEINNETYINKIVKMEFELYINEEKIEAFNYSIDKPIPSQLIQDDIFGNILRTNIEDNDKVKIILKCTDTFGYHYYYEDKREADIKTEMFSTIPSHLAQEEEPIFIANSN